MVDFDDKTNDGLTDFGPLSPRGRTLSYLYCRVAGIKPQLFPVV